MDKCVLCRSEETVEYIHGRLYETKNVKAHLFCLLFGPNLPQNGKDNEGIEGFLIKDIRKEEIRVRPLVCCYCKKKHANLGCSVRQCKRAFHTECGYKHDVSFEFTSRFPCFCIDHSKNNLTSSPSNDDFCSICLQGFEENVRKILMPCCENTWFHHSCIQTFAQTAGLYFKCPNCNDQENCLQLLPILGVHIYHKDADWEIEHDNLEDFETIPCESDGCNGTPETSFSVASTSQMSVSVNMSVVNDIEINDNPVSMEISDTGGSTFAETDVETFGEYFHNSIKKLIKSFEDVTLEDVDTENSVKKSLNFLSQVGIQYKNKEILETLENEYLNNTCLVPVPIEISYTRDSTFSVTDVETLDEDFHNYIEELIKTLEDEDSENSVKQNLNFMSQVAVSMEDSDATSGENTTSKASAENSYDSEINKALEKFQPKTDEILDELENESEINDKENENLSLSQVAVSIETSEPKDSTFNITNDESSKKVKSIDEKSSESTSQNHSSSSAFQGFSSIISVLKNLKKINFCQKTESSDRGS